MTLKGCTILFRNFTNQGISPKPASFVLIKIVNMKKTSSGNKVLLIHYILKYQGVTEDLSLMSVLPSYIL